MLNKVSVIVDSHTKVNFVSSKEANEHEIVIAGKDGSLIEISGNEHDLIRLANQIYRKVAEKQESKLLSERFSLFVEQHRGYFGTGEGKIPERLYSDIEEYDMCGFRFNIDEAHRDMDCGLELFEGYELDFIVNNERITVEVSNEHMPVVKIGDETKQFGDYYDADSQAAYNLDAFFLKFARMIADKKRYAMARNE